MAPLNQKTAGHAKKLYLTGMYPNGKKVKSTKMDALFTDLMAYADKMGSASALTLKAELHSRSTQLSLEVVQDNTEKVFDGTAQSQEGALEMVELAKNLLTHAKKHAKTTTTTHKFADALQANVAAAQAKVADAGNESINTASSSSAALDQKDTILRQRVDDLEALAMDFDEQGDKGEIYKVKIEVLHHRLQESNDKLQEKNDNVQALEEELQQLQNAITSSKDLQEDYATISIDYQDQEKTIADKIEELGQVKEQADSLRATIKNLEDNLKDKDLENDLDFQELAYDCELQKKTIADEKEALGKASKREEDLAKKADEQARMIKKLKRQAQVGRNIRMVKRRAVHDATPSEYFSCGEGSTASVLGSATPTEGFTQFDVTVKVEGDEGGPESTTEGGTVSECGSSERDRWFASGSESNVEG